LAKALDDREEQFRKEQEKTLAELVDKNNYTVKKCTWGQDPPTYNIEGDDKFKTLKW